MRSRASWRSETTQHDRSRPNPFRAPFHWDIAPDRLRLELAAGDGPAGVTLPARPTLLTGGVAHGARATIDAIVGCAAVERWAIARVAARPEHRLRSAVAAGLEHAVETIARDHTGDITAARMRTIVEAFRSSTEPDDLTYAPVLGALAAAAADARWGIMLAVDDVHAAHRRESEPLLGATAAVMAYNPSFRSIMSATHRSCVAIEPATRDIWVEVSLTLTPNALADVLGGVAARHDRCFAPDAVDALYRASDGVPDFAFTQAAGAWDSTRDPVISAARVTAAAERADAARAAQLRATWSTQLSLGQRRYLRAVAEHGERGADIEIVARDLGGVTRFGLSPSMLDGLLTLLVQRGLLVVHEGMACIAVPGLSRIL